MDRRVQVELGAPAARVRDRATASRGSVNGVLLVCGVVGSAAGLLVTTVLEGPVGGVGPAVALCGLAPRAAALLLLPLVPETAALGLDDISPTEG